MSEVMTAVLTGIGAMIGWGVPDVMSKKGVDKIGSKLTTFLYLLMGLVLAPLLLIFDSSMPQFSWGLLVGILLFGINDFVAISLMFRAFEVGKVSIIITITSGYAVLSSIISFLFFHEPFTVLKFVAICLVVLGILCVSVRFSDLKSSLKTQNALKGVPLALVIFVLYGLTVPFYDHFLNHSGWPVSVILMRVVTVVLTFIVASRSVNKITSRKNLPIVGLVLIAGTFQAFGSMSFNLGFATTTLTSVVNTIGSAYPLVLVVLSAIFLKERLAFNQYVGIALVIGGTILLALS